MNKTKVIEGVGQDAPIVTLPGGGKQSEVPARMDLIDGHAIIALGRVLKEGAEKYPENNWRKIPTISHLNKALIHIYSFIAGDTQDNHLDHAFCRMMMAVATTVRSGPIEWKEIEGEKQLRGYVDSRHRYSLIFGDSEVKLFKSGEHYCFDKVDATFHSVEEAKAYAEMLEYERE
jgi:hypothetical protein